MLAPGTDSGNSLTGIWSSFTAYQGDKLFPKTDSEDYPGLLPILEPTQVYQLEKKIKSEER